MWKFGYVLLGALAFLPAPAAAETVCEAFDRKVRHMDVDAMGYAMPSLHFYGERNVTRGHPFRKGRDDGVCRVAHANIDAAWLYYAHSPEMITSDLPMCSPSDDAERKRFKSAHKRLSALNDNRPDLRGRGGFKYSVGKTKLEKVCPPAKARLAPHEPVLMSCYLDYVRSDVLPAAAIYLKDAYLETGTEVGMLDDVAKKSPELYNFGNHIRAVHTRRAALNSRNMTAVQAVLGCRLDMSKAKAIDAEIAAEWAERKQVASARSAARQAKADEKRAERQKWLTTFNADKRAARFGRTTADEPSIYAAQMTYGRFDPAACDAVSKEIERPKVACVGDCPFHISSFHSWNNEDKWSQRWRSLKASGTPVCDAIPTSALNYTRDRQLKEIEFEPQIAAIEQRRARRAEAMRNAPSFQEMLNAWGESRQNLLECENRYGRGQCVEVKD